MDGLTRADRLEVNVQKLSKIHAVQDRAGCCLVKQAAPSLDGSQQRLVGHHLGMLWTILLHWVKSETE